MADISLTKENIKYIRDAFSHFFPEDTIYSADKPYVSGEFNWENRRSFIDFVYRLTGVQIKSEKDFQNIKKAELVVEESVETGEEKPEGNTQTKEQREQAEKIRQEREASEKGAKEVAEKSVEKSVERQEELAKEAREKKAIQEAKEKIKATITKEQEVQETLRGKKIYVKVEISKTVPPPEESTLNFIKEAKTHPASFQKDLAENIKAKITPSLSTKLTEAEIDILAQKTAFDTVFAINNFPAQSAANTQTAILGALAKESQLLPKIIDSKDALQILQKSSDELSFFKNGTQISKNVLSSINENLATTVFGVGPENLNVTFFEKPVEGYTHEVDFGQLSEGHINLLGSEMKVFDNVGSFAGGEARNYLMGHARTFLDSQIIKLPADSAVTGFYNSKLGQQVLSFAGLGKANPLGGGFLQSFVQRIPGSSAFFEGLGNTLGVDFGISMAVPTAEIAGPTVLATEGAVLVEGVALAEGAALTGGVVAAGGAAIGVETQAVKKVAGGIVGKGLMAVATKVGLGSTITAIGQALGSFAPIVGNAIAFAATWLIGKIAKKINWAKVKEWGGAIIGGVAGLIALPFLGIGAAVGIGLGATAVSAGLGAGIGGLTLGGIGAGIAGFFGALGGAFLGAVGTPILVTLLAFPVVVAIILFIINSGAYIVPPTASTVVSNLTNPYIGVEKVASPKGPFQNSQLPLAIKYTVTVSAKIGAVTNVVFSDECQAIKKTGPVPCPTITLPDAPETISPSNPYVFDYSVTYEAGTYSDSAIINNIKVTADTLDAGDQTATGGVSIIIGDPPTECFTFDNTWDAYPSYKAQMMGAIAELSKATTYMSTLCPGHTIPLSYTGRQTGYAAEVSGGTIYFHVFGLSLGAHGTLYTLTHETGHLYAAWIPGKLSTFLYNDGVKSEGFICTYLLTQTQAEDFPEMIALFVSHTSNTNSACLTNYKIQYPNHWQFARNNIFYSNLDW